jgi:hypothetical protein
MPSSFSSGSIFSLFSSFCLVASTAFFLSEFNAKKKKTFKREPGYRWLHEPILYGRCGHGYCDEKERKVSILSIKIGGKKIRELTETGTHELHAVLWARRQKSGEDRRGKSDKIFTRKLGPCSMSTARGKEGLDPA